MLTITFPFRTLSINHYHAHARNGREYITKEGMAYKTLIEKTLMQNKKELNEFFKDFDDGKDFLRIGVSCYYENFYTKKKEINSRCPDCDNVLKIIIDSVFNFIVKNDKCVIDIISTKRESQTTDYFVFQAWRYE
jgi:Holliday junction resolvase RusA-like endonuclease